jgi:O-antigen/teichoic acid export membrane protein
MLLKLDKITLRVKNSAFVKNILIVMSGTGLAQMIGFALLPVISRLFTPEDFGVFGSFNAVVGVIAAGVTLDYSQAIMLPKEKNDAFHLFFISCLSTLFIAFLCALACLIAPASLMELMKAPGIWVLVLLVFTILITGFNVALQAWCVRTKAFKHTAASQVIRSLSSNGMQVGFGFLRTGPIGLIISSVLADLLASINLLRVFLADFKKSVHKISWRRIKKLAKEYQDFPLYSASQNVINALSSGIPVLLLTHFFSIAVAGGYAFGIRILHTPMGLLTRALRQVLFQKASETQQHGGSLLSLYVKITAGLFTVGLFPALIIIIWAPQIFDLIFGARWYTAGEYARSLVVWLLFVFCNVPAVLFARLIRIQRAVFFYDLVLLAARVSALVISGLYLTAIQSITIFSILGAVMNLVLILLVGYNVIKKEGEKKCLRQNHLVFGKLMLSWKYTI